MAGTKRITADVVEAVKPGEVVWDSEVRGFGVRRQSRASVYVLKTRIGGAQRYLTIGRHGSPWDEGKLLGPLLARREAQRLVGMIRDGKDPTQERGQAKAAASFAELAARYMTEYAEPRKKPRTRAEDARLLKLHILPTLGKMKARDIGKVEVARLHASLRAKPVAANRALALLSAIMTWAESVDERPDQSNPCRSVARFPERARERMLNAEELARLGAALDRAERGWTEDELATLSADGRPKRVTPEDWRAVAAFRLLIFTGARLSEILTIKWDWIDMAMGTARLPDSKTGAKTLPLPPPALAVIEALPRLAGSPYVLPGDRPGKPFIGIQKPWQRVRSMAGLSDLRLHDLRHAFASVAVAGGESLYVVGKVLGHRQADTTSRYAHLAEDPMKAAAGRIAARLAGMMSPMARPIPALEGPSDGESS